MTVSQETRKKWQQEFAPLLLQFVRTGTDVYQCRTLQYHGTQSVDRRCVPAVLQVGHHRTTCTLSLSGLITSLSHIKRQGIFQREVCWENTEECCKNCWESRNFIEPFENSSQAPLFTYLYRRIFSLTCIKILCGTWKTELFKFAAS